MTLHEKINLKGEIERQKLQFVSYMDGWNITKQEQREYANGFKWVDLEWPYQKAKTKQLNLWNHH